MMMRFGIMVGRGLAIAVFAVVLACLGGRGAMAHAMDHHQAQAATVSVVPIDDAACAQACDGQARLPCCTDAFCLIGFAGLAAPPPVLADRPGSVAMRLHPSRFRQPSGVRPAIPSPPPRAIA